MMGRHPAIRRVFSIAFFVFLFGLSVYGFYTVDSVCRRTLWGEEAPLWQTAQNGNMVQITLQGFGRSFSFSVPDIPRIVNNMVEYVDKKLQEVIQFLQDRFSFGTKKTKNLFRPVDNSVEYVKIKLQSVICGPPGFSGRFYRSFAKNSNFCRLFSYSHNDIMFMFGKCDLFRFFSHFLRYKTGAGSVHPSIFKKGDPFMNRWKKWMVLGAALVLFSMNTMTVLAEENTAIQVTEEETQEPDVPEESSESSTQESSQESSQPDENTSSSSSQESSESQDPGNSDSDDSENSDNGKDENTTSRPSSNQGSQGTNEKPSSESTESSSNTTQNSKPESSSHSSSSTTPTTTPSPTPTPDAFTNPGTTSEESSAVSEESSLVSENSEESSDLLSSSLDVLDENAGISGDVENPDNSRMNLLGILAWVCIGLGVLVVIIVLLSNRTGNRTTGRRRYQRRPVRRKKKHLLSDKYYSNYRGRFR